MPSPQTGGGPQSISQLNPSSTPSQVKSPQQVGAEGTSVQLPPQRGSLHASGFWPSPSSQQNLPDGLPFCFPAQSCGQDTQSSPSPGSHTPFPQLAPLPLTQSAGHELQSSPHTLHAPQSSGHIAQYSPTSHVPSPHTGPALLT